MIFTSGHVKNEKQIKICRPLLYGILNSFLFMSLLKNLIFARRLRRKKLLSSSCHITHRLGRLRSSREVEINSGR